MLSIIIVSAFDHHRLTLTLKSIESCGEEIELIVVYPADDNDTKILLDNFKKSHNFRVKEILDHSEGIYRAMNIGLTNFESEYCLFLNSGDLLLSSQNLMNVLSILKTKRPGWAIALSKFEWRSTPENNDSNLEAFLKQKGGFVSHQSVIASRNLIDQVGGFDLRYRVASDTNLIIALSEIQKPEFLSGYLTFVQTPEFSSKNHRKSRIELLQIYSRLKKNKIKWPGLINLLFRECQFFYRKIFLLSPYRT